MNNQIIEGNWKQLKGKVREQWGKLTDDDMDVIAGKRDQLIGKLEERYGKTRDAVREEVAAFERELDEQQLAGVGAGRHNK
jgi:uncharacterized protein YjbJ (UPF0337 family)